MFDHLLAPLRDTFSPHFTLRKTRLEAMAAIMLGLVNCRTVNLTHLAAHLPGKALYKSKYRRLQHFSKKVHFDQPAVAGFIMRLLNQKGAKHLALDRTNWKLGKAHINILVLALVTRKFRIPIMWSHMGHGGNSSTEQRIELMRRYIDEFGVESIQSLLADREFVGDDWFTYLVENKLPFVIRLRKDMHIETEDGKHFQFFSLLRKRCKGQWKGWLCGMARTPENLLRFEGKKIKNELVIEATNIPAPKSALRLYRKRWGIECLFADAKTKGFNIEDTHMIDPSKLTTLFIMVTLSMTWSYRCSSQEMGRGSIRKKKHGRFEKSWFRTGLDALRNWILHDPEEALSAWRRYCPKRPISNRCIIGILQ